MLSTRGRSSFWFSHFLFCYFLKGLDALDLRNVRVAVFNRTILCQNGRISSLAQSQSQEHILYNPKTPDSQLTITRNSWVKTQMGQDFAHACKYAGEIPTDVPTSAKGVIERVCNAESLPTDCANELNRSIP